jgi:hypothetical protein
MPWATGSSTKVRWLPVPDAEDNLRQKAIAQGDSHHSRLIGAGLSEDIMNARRLALVLATTVAATTLSIGSAPAFAKGGDDDVRASSACSTGVIKPEAKHDDGLIEVEAEVDTNRNGQVWSVKLVDNGVTAWSGTRTTVAPSGSFSVEKRIVNRSGLDKITVRATRGSTVCSTSVSL